MFTKYQDTVVFNTNGGTQIPRLENKVYLLKQSMELGFYLKETESFSFPPVVYGDPEVMVERYLKKFNNTSKNLGIFLSGNKGSGKSLIAKMTAAKSGLPVILITQPYAGSNFEDLLANVIKQEAVIFIDEFEKVYKEYEDQAKLLPVLDGVFTSKKLFIFTSNSKDINEYMKNRPGRIHFWKEFHQLDNKVINDIIDTELKNLDYKEELLQVCNIINNVNIDSLKAIITDINLYEERPKEVVRHMNIRPETTNSSFEMHVMRTDDNVLLGFVKYLFQHPLDSDYVDSRITLTEEGYIYYNSSEIDGEDKTKDLSKIFNLSDNPKSHRIYMETSEEEGWRRNINDEGNITVFNEESKVYFLFKKKSYSASNTFFVY